MIDKKYMAPLWIKYPEISESSIGWRMGYGEVYAEEFYDWFYALSKEEKKEFEEKFPKPLLWNIMMYEICTYNNYHIRKWKKIRGYSVDTLIEERKAGLERPIICFWGHRNRGRSVGKECFSQWYKADFRVNHLRYCCMEQYMMAEKARIFGDEEIAKQIMDETMQDKIKGLGRKVKNFDENIWNEVKYHIVLTGNYYKFSQNKQLRQVLLSTGESILVEASPLDMIWGIGIDANNENAYHPEKWNGSNLLGFALTEVREEIKRIRKYENEILNLQDDDA